LQPDKKSNNNNVVTYFFIMTVFGSANVRRLEADKLIPFRQIKVAGFSPVLRLSHERNASSIGLYDYDRNAFEFGISRAF
jgi:hypothetical protein